jgi:hypothetical protein
MPNLTLAKPRNAHVPSQPHLIAVRGRHSAISLSRDRVVEPPTNKMIGIGPLKAGSNIQSA